MLMECSWLVVWGMAAEFIHLLSSEANEVCTKEGKKTIGPKHVIEALKVRRTTTTAAAVCCAMSSKQA